MTDTLTCSLAKPMQNIIIQDRGFKRLLSIDADAKTIKGKIFGYQTAICYLAPADIAFKRSVCPHSTPECRFGCLYSAGHGGLTSVQKVRIARTHFFWNHPEKFYAELRDEIRAHIKRAIAAGRIPVVRLNGTSDIQHEKSGIFADFPGIRFYDYTKFPRELRTVPENYHLTYSFTGLDGSADRSFEYAADGFNTAVVFRGGFPAAFLGRPILDGDKSDLRFLDPAGHIVGLKAKGKCISDFVSKFVVNGILSDRQARKLESFKRAQLAIAA